MHDMALVLYLYILSARGHPSFEESLAISGKHGLALSFGVNCDSFDRG